MIGKLYIAGVGPGDPELITMKAVRILTRVDVIAAPEKDGLPGVAYQIAEQAVPEIKEKELLLIDFPMTKDTIQLSEAHEKAIEDIKPLLKRGREVALLTLGDPTIYSSGMYIADRISSIGFDVELISGVTAYSAAAAKLLISIASGAESVLITTPDGADLSKADTVIVMKAGKVLRKLKDNIRAVGKNPYMIENCGMVNERMYKGVDDIPDEAGYYSILIVK